MAKNPMIKRLVKRLSKTQYVRNAIEERADLSAFKQKPTKRIVIGLIVIAISYIIGWPAVGAFGVLSVYLEKPLILIIGGPVIYGLSHVVFIIGMYLAGAEHTKIFLRWATRVGMEKLGGAELIAAARLGNSGSPESKQECS